MRQRTKQGKKNWERVSNDSLINAYRYRKKNNIQISDELNAELAKRFSNYDPETKMFKHKKDWSKTSDNCLMSAYFYYQQRYNKPMPEELHAELTKRFSNYDPETKTFKTKQTDWSKSSDQSLISSCHYHKKHNMQIPEGLNAELAKRFPGYDPETKTFKNKQTDWSKSSDQSLITACYYRKKHNMQIPAELTAELKKRCLYNKQKRHNSTRIDWENFTEQQLKNVYYRMKRKLHRLPTKLNLELANRFSDYDPQEQKFNKTIKKKNVFEYTNRTLQVTYYEYHKLKKPIPDELNAELAKRFSNYDPETQKFKQEKTKNKSYTEFADNTLRSAYHKFKKQKLPIPDELNAELANRFSNYDPETQKFKPKTKSYADCTESALRSAYYEHKEQKLPIPDELNTELAKRFPGYDPEQKIFDVLEQISREEARAEKLHKLVMKSKNKKIIVSVQTVDVKEAVTYNDIFINGTKILSNHIDTEIKLLCDDTILAIHGIITNDVHYPHTPTWLAYNAQMKSLSPTQANTYSNYYVQINNIRDINDKINIFFNNKTTVVLSKEKLKRVANGHYFVLENQKTR